VRLPDDFEIAEIAGHDVRYQVTVREIKEPHRPTLDEEFVRSVRPDADSVETLRTRIAGTLGRGVSSESLAEYHDTILGMLMNTAQVDYPDVLAEREIDRLVEEQTAGASRSPETLARWLSGMGVTEAQLRQELAGQADLNLRSAMVLDEFVRAEGLRVSAADIDARIDDLAALTAGPSAGERVIERVRRTLDTDATRHQVRSELTLRGAVDRLAEICSGSVEESGQDT
jgi:trigger factor